MMSVPANHTAFLPKSMATGSAKSAGIGLLRAALVKEVRPAPGDEA